MLDEIGFHSLLIEREPRRHRSQRLDQARDSQGIGRARVRASFECSPAPSKETPQLQEGVRIASQKRIYSYIDSSEHHFECSIDAFLSFAVYTCIQKTFTCDDEYDVFEGRHSFVFAPRVYRIACRLHHSSERTRSRVLRSASDSRRYSIGPRDKPAHSRASSRNGILSTLRWVGCLPSPYRRNRNSREFHRCPVLYVRKRLNGPSLYEPSSGGGRSRRSGAASPRRSSERLAGPLPRACSGSSECRDTLVQSTDSDWFASAPQSSGAISTHSSTHA